MPPSPSLKELTAITGEFLARTIRCFTERNAEAARDIRRDSIAIQDRNEAILKDMDYAAELLGAGLTVIDLSADFRLADAAVYAAWYGQAHRHPELLSQAVYGLPELYANDIKKARLVANPGCYPTSVILGLAPALTADIIETNDIVADSKSGASGAGRKAAAANLFCEVHDSFRAYSLGKHRHTPEIEQELGKLAGVDMASDSPGCKVGSPPEKTTASRSPRRPSSQSTNRENSWPSSPGPISRKAAFWQ